MNILDKLKDNRRKFLLTSARTIGLAILGGLTWSAYLSEVKATSLILRPPAALNEDDFLASCIKCGLCVVACPFDTLKLAKPGDNMPLGTPYFVPRDIPCYMCVDIPCVPICPTNALDEKLVKNSNNEFEIKQMKMGVAIVDEKSCVAFWGIQCDACYRACPLLGEAINIVYEKNERTGKHAFLKPAVNSDICTGCGLCEKACITQKASILVLPREIALGKVGDHYIKGWDESDEKRVKSPITNINERTINQKDAIDSLNSGMKDLLE